MNTVIKEYHRFNTFGIEENLVSPEDDATLEKLYHIRNFLLKAKDQNQLVIELYPDYKQLAIFNGLKARHGQKTRITFINDRGNPVEIKTACKYSSDIVLKCIFCRTRISFGMYLNTFIDEIKKNNITKIHPKGFARYYLKSISDALSDIDSELQELEDKYNKIYKEKAEELKREYEAELSKYPKLESRKLKKELSPEEALNKAIKTLSLNRTKTYWNTKLSEEEKNTLLQWISKNIYSIRVYGVIDGRSGNVLSQEYSDVEGVKLREVKRDDENQVISNDNITAHISFKTLEGAPKEIFEKIVSPKRRSKNIFYNNRLNDKNLALFLLAEYKDKGFKAGVRNLYKNINF